jgi:diguanylate cyclase (GGDEF)-like protein/PAS domain S-box-containing protein
MSISNRAGLSLRNAAERDIFRATLAECGLDIVDHESSEVGELLIIITDESADDVGEARQLQAPETTFFGVAHTTAKALVRDRPQTRTEENRIAGVEDLRYAWIFDRPLQCEVIRSQLHQALRACRAFAQHHQSMMEEFHRFRRIFDSVCNGITVCDARLPDLPLIYVNPAFEQMTGYSAAETNGRNCRFLQGSDIDQPGVSKVKEAIRNQREVRVLLRNYRKDRTSFWNELYLSPILDLEGNLTHFVGIQNDVTALVESQRELKFLAHHDNLTGLANRRVLIENLNKAILRASRRIENLAVLFFDINNFKSVNDVFGHDAGDNVLKIIAERLRECTRASETVARLGGDEFVVVLEDFSADRQPVEVMQRLTSKINEAIDLFDQPFHPSASVGMAIFPLDGTTPEALLKVADFNMYLNKHNAQDAVETNEETVILNPWKSMRP